MSDTHAQTARFVRESMLPPAEPPVAAVGWAEGAAEDRGVGEIGIVNQRQRHRDTGVTGHGGHRPALAGSS